MIRALIYKDVLVLWKKQKLLLLMMIMFFSFAALELGYEFFAIYPAVALCTMSLNTISFDEKSGWEKYAAALPYGVRRIVTAKYLLTLGGIVAATALYLLSGLICSLIRRTGMSLPVDGFSAILFASTASMAVMLPVTLCFGMEKSRIIYLILVCAAVGAAMYIPRGGLVLPWSRELSPWLFLTGMLLLCALLWALSWLISVRLYQKKPL